MLPPMVTIPVLCALCNFRVKNPCAPTVADIHRKAPCTMARDMQTRKDLRMGPTTDTLLNLG